MKPKYRLKKYKCPYCEWRHDKLKKIIKHEEEIHGYFRNKNNKQKNEPIEDKPKHPDVAGKLKVYNKDMLIDIIYKWNNKTAEYDMFTDETKYGNDIKIIWDNDNNRFKLCNIKKLRKDWENDKMPKV